ncbi:MAG TPA: GIY-YIG nuclease family protein [Gemmatimonadaceae bacterium]|jgi:putative endonuclease
MPRYFFVYIVSSETRVLYIGITRELEIRLHQHRTAMGSKFCFRYKVFRLVFYEVFEDPYAAITREKQLKGWTRAKKVALIKRENPMWRDLSLDW